MDLFLHNTLTRKKERFEPLDPERVRLYVCGPTVYQRIHVGNARPFVVFDVLFRLLRNLYGERHVTYVRNITDIEDKIVDQARKNGESIGELTERTTAQFHADCQALGLLPPTHEPRATQFVPDMIRLIGELIERGHAYAAEGHVLFSVPSMPAYGRLSGRDREQQIAGARVEVAPYKRDPADFVLWKPSTDDQPGWDSPWGRGRPGWHIECSAMSEHFLGVPFDIHGGGIDLIFPHHENEIAQTCCAHGLEEMARYWVHNGFLDMRGEKMSKSLGNIVRVDEALAMAPGEALRFLLLSTHYRQPADFTEAALDEARNSLRRFYRVLDDIGIGPEEEAEPDEAIVDALADDLNTPAALAVLHATATQANRERGTPDGRAFALQLKGQASLLGLLQDDPEAWLRSAGRASELSDGHVEERLVARREARKAKDFALADAIRKELEAAGIVLKDRPDGRTDWERR